MKQRSLWKIICAAVMCTFCASLVPALGASSDTYIIPVKETAVIPAEYPENSVATGASVDPVIIKMGTVEEMEAQNAEYYAHTHAGVYEPYVVDGVSCVKLSYSKPEMALLPEYRFMPKFPDNELLTSDHKYMRVTFMTNDTYPSELIICNPGNTNGGYTPLMSDCSVSDGEWVRSVPVSIEGNGCLTRFLTNAHCALGFYTTSLNAEYYISEIGFFGSVQQAYEYYGEDYINSSNGCIEMNFADGSGDTYDGETYGNHQLNTGTMSLDIMYADETNIVPDGQTRWCSYLAKIKFGATTPYSSDYRYMRVLYSAENPEGVTGASMYIWTDTGHYAVKLVDNIQNTDGAFVLSDTALISQYAGDRFAGTGNVTSRTHNSLFINTDKEGGLYSIKSIYFFNTRKAADEFVLGNAKADVSINGTDISNYKVVVSDKAPYHVTNAAMSLVKYIEGLTNVTLPIVTDREPVSEYEILLGVSDREKSRLEYYEDILPIAADSRNVVKVSGNDVIITSELPALLSSTAAKFMRSALYSASTNVPEHIDVSDMTEVVSTSSMASTKYKNNFYTNTDSPVRFTDDFDSDDGYFTEKNGADVWKIENGVLTANADEFTVTHMQVFEPNVTFSAKMKYSDAGENGDIGLMLRRNADDAWVKAGYDFTRGEWYIENRMGTDFYVIRNASSSAELNPDTEYVLTFTVDRYTASLYVNGKKVLTTNDIGHSSPGMIAFFAEDVTATFDDADVLMLSGEGTILPNVYHTQLDPNTWLAGGTVLAMQDGTLRYTSRKFANLVSTDGGKSWEKADIFIDSSDEPNILRLNNGNLLMVEVVGDSVVSSISDDDGESWEEIGYVCPSVYNNDTEINAKASNIQDRIFQSPTTDRIFFCQNYASDTSSVDGRKVFCVIYYSDDNGESWFKSETDPWEIVGNENEVYFGELKILECSDGSLRIYCSWNQYGCIVYSESTDNGVTWGSLVEMPEFKCSHSTMAFARDPNGETDHTYYMVWVYSVDDIAANMPRSRLSLAKTTDGKNWVYLGDLWRWESEYKAYNIDVHINHIVNPFIYVTDDAVICGTGASERMSFSHHHQQQRQNIWTVMKDTLPEGRELTVEEDTEETPKHVIIDMSSQATAEQYLEFSSYPTDTEQIQGYYTFDNGEKALSLLYTDQYVIGGTEHGTMRYTLRPKASNLFEGLPYMVVTYKTDITSKLPLRIFNFWKHFRQLADDIRVSDGEYVRTEPFNINIYESGSQTGSNYFTRLNGGNHILIGVNNQTDPDAYFYIKEIAFFESAEAAEAWYPDIEGDSEPVCGDLDGDGRITLADLANFGRALAKWTDYSSPEDTSVFDLNSDGKVTPLDLVYLSRHLAGWDEYETLPLAK